MEFRQFIENSEIPRIVGSPQRHETDWVITIQFGDEDIRYKYVVPDSQELPKIMAQFRVMKKGVRAAARKAYNRLKNASITEIRIKGGTKEYRDKNQDGSWGEWRSTFKPEAKPELPEIEPPAPEPGPLDPPEPWDGKAGVHFWQPSIEDNTKKYWKRQWGMDR